MIIPHFWAEFRAHRPRSKSNGQVTVRRFGWSNTSQAEAENMAQARANAALERHLAGDTLRQFRELKTPYNGADGVPIREEILATHGEAVITRNIYGAQCLNTPDVVFADVDFSSSPGIRSVLLHTAALIAAFLLLPFGFKWFVLILPAGLVSLILGYFLAKRTQRAMDAVRGGPVGAVKFRLQSFLKGHPDWLVRLYRTPAGLRLLVLNRTFRSDDPVVLEFFKILEVDPRYAAMCRSQRCFRARLTAKPWRIGVSDRIGPRPGVWPIKPEYLERRRTWVHHYEAVADAFAACTFLETVGTGSSDAKALRVQELHDRLSHALSGKPIA